MTTIKKTGSRPLNRARVSSCGSSKKEVKKPAGCGGWVSKSTRGKTKKTTTGKTKTVSGCGTLPSNDSGRISSCGSGKVWKGGKYPSGCGG